MLWARETEGGNFETPERRAGLEARLNQVTAAIANEAVRKYYRQDFETRTRQLFAPLSSARGEQRFAPRYDSRGGGRSGFGRDRRGAGRGGLMPMFSPPSAALTASSIVRGYRSSFPPREALILLAVVNHPWLLEDHSEELAGLEFLYPDADRLRRGILDAASGHDHDTASLRAAIDKRNLGAVLARAESATQVADWPARPEAAPEDVRQWWQHVVTLHRKSRTLNKELREAEQALAADPSEEHLGWLRDVQERLAALEGTEATIDGFGALSGRRKAGV
jgi:DNA primase